MGALTLLAVDGGNSTTRVVVGSTAGEVLGWAVGPGCSPHDMGVPGTVAALDALVDAALAQAGLPTADRAQICLAGVDLPVEEARMNGAVAATGWARASRVDNDVFALLRAGTAAADAVAVVCGAGINCVGRSADGATARFPALGSITGDWGGGHHLARLALWHGARGEDGRGPATALTAAVAAHFGRSTVEEAGVALHLGEIESSRVPELAPVLFAVAGAGDPVAGAVVARQAREVVALVTVAARRLGLLTREFDVVLGGGVLAARHPQLHDAVVAGVSGAAPLARVSVVTDPPVTGAALLALDALGATIPAVEAALRVGVRAALSDRRWSI